MPVNNKGTNIKNKRAVKRKRVNRLKTIIIAGAVILLFTSFILNFILLFKIMHLESQIDQLYSVDSVFVL